MADNVSNLKKIDVNSEIYFSQGTKNSFQFRPVTSLFRFALLNERMGSGLRKLSTEYLMS